jgi:hypothetical protein
MIATHNAIARINRDLTVGRMLNVLLLLSVGISFFFFFGGFIRTGVADMVALLVFTTLWIFLGLQSMRGTRLAAGSSSLIATGQFDQAEHQIDQAMRSFSLFRTAKLMSLHHLAVLRHAQRRWPEAAELCRALLSQRLGSLKGLSRQSRLVLADSLLELGDVRGAYDAINGLYAQRLTLAEALSLLAVQLDYLSRIHAWEAMLEGLASRVQLAELTTTHNAARVQALLALAARKLGRTQLQEYLWRRVELLTDLDELVKERPILRELYRTTSGSPQSIPPVESKGE